ncbi:MAG: ACP S-malonyltransferase [Halanaerobiaceae bacterium]
MTKIGYVFPGQGSQNVGMGKDLIENYSEAQTIINQVNDILGFNLKNLMIKGPETELNNTKNTQPAIFTISYILNQILHKNNIKPDIVAGHSLGEYSALAAVGAFNFKEGVKLVRKRGILMNEAVPADKGSMAAIIGLSLEKIETVCDQTEGVLEVANYNTPGQIVVSGEKESVRTGMKLARDMGAKKVIELKVSGPFHSSLMKPVQNKFKREIEKINLNPVKIPLIANVTAKKITEIDEIKEELIAQLNHSVLWVDSVKLMIKEGVDVILEVGPGRVLKSLIRRIDRTIRVISVKDKKSLDKAIDEFRSN